MNMEFNVGMVLQGNYFSYEKKKFVFLFSFLIHFRSTKVNIRCGSENKLVSAAEPNRCEYEFMFETPAVCEPLPPLNHDEL